MKKRNYNHIEINYKDKHYKSYKDLWRDLNLPFTYKIFMQRINRGLSIKEAIEKKYKPICEKNISNKTTLIEYKNKKYTSYHKLWESQKTNISYSRFMARIQLGYSIEESLLPSGEYVNKPITFLNKSYKNLYSLWKDIPNNINYDNFTTNLRKKMPILAALKIIPYIHKRMKHQYKNFRPNFIINKFEYNGIDNQEYWSCIINSQELILSVNEIYERMETIVIEEFNNDTFKLSNQTTEKSGN